MSETRLMLRRRLLVLVVTGSVAGCTEWNERRASFDTYAEFSASAVGQNGQVPRDLVPRSARNLRFVRNIDTTEVRIEFDFDPADERAVVAPFLSSGRQLDHSHIEIRCGVGAVEFLRITDHKRASYWTSWDPEVRANSCRKAAEPAEPGAMTTATI